MDKDAPPPQDWTAALDEARADLAAGRVEDGAEMHRELQASIERMTRDVPDAQGRPARA